MARLREQLSEAIEQRDIERLMHQQLELARRMQSLKNFSPQEASFVNEEHAGA
jgi:predicted house-cleaning noncanonical NTP pyrophosphatase (MazG superfamily)